MFVYGGDLLKPAQSLSVVRGISPFTASGKLANTQ
jgi:hypothetical protein